MPDLDEQILAYQEDLERRRQEDRRRQQIQQGLNKLAQTQRVLEKAGAAAGKGQFKKLAVKTALRSILPALWTIIVAASPFILIGALVLFIIFLTIYMVCNPHGLLALLASYGNELTGTIPDSVCQAFRQAAQ